MTKIDQMTVGTARTGLSPARVRQDKTSSQSDTSAARNSTATDDTVNLTGDAMQLQDLGKSLSGEAPIDTKRVAALRASIASGSYKIDSQSIASKLLNIDGVLGKN